MTSYKAKDHYQQEEIAAAYDAERFRGLRGRSVDWLERRLLDKAMEGLEARLQVLDLPVGTGRMARYLTSKGHHVVGSDISLAMMEVGRKLGTYLRARRRDELERKKRDYIEKYIPHVGIALQEILGLSDKAREDTVVTLTETLERSRNKK